PPPRPPPPPPGAPSPPRLLPRDPPRLPLTSDPAGRRALLGVVRRSRHREVPLRELRQRRAPPGARLGVGYLLHDLLGAQLLRSIPTTSGPMLRLAEP
ncbi:STK19 kinase, partial [Calonectris borealis]|nr:STK19 kinase [Calonectris borealis]